MSANDELLAIIEEIDVLVAELRELNESGPHFRILHRFHAPGTDCAPGEEIAGIWLVHRGREYQLKVSLALRLLFDYLARHSHLPQSATQIEAGIRATRFYTEHGATVDVKNLNRSIPRRYIRVYIERLRLAIEEAFRNLGLLVDGRRVLLSEETMMNEVGYRTKATFDWVHHD